MHLLIELTFWCDLADDSRIFPFMKATNTIRIHWSGSINYIESEINNGILKGLNSKIQLAKKKGKEDIEIPIILLIWVTLFVVNLNLITHCI